MIFYPSPSGDNYRNYQFIYRQENRAILTLDHHFKKIPRIHLFKYLE